jgi:hypothetical protein
MPHPNAFTYSKLSGEARIFYHTFLQKILVGDGRELNPGFRVKWKSHDHKTIGALFK